MLMPPISRYMSKQPWTIRKDATMAQAHALMREHKIRHLPVLAARKLVGIVTERDLHLIETLPDSNPAETKVEEAMTVDVYAVGGDDPVAAIVETMATHKYGSAVIIDDDGAVEGIFTTVDALQAFADLLRRAAA